MLFRFLRSVRRPRHAPRIVFFLRLGDFLQRGLVSFLVDRRALLVALVIAIVSQLCGINAIMYYSTRIFSHAGIGIANAFWATMLVGLVNLIFTLVATAFIDRAGRRKLLLLGLAIQTASLTIVGLLFLHPGRDLLLLGAILVFIAAFAMALGPISWLLPSEIFSDAVRGRAMSLATISNWGFNLVVTITFLGLIDLFGRTGTFLLYAVLTLTALVFTAVLVPETKGRSLEEIEDAPYGVINDVVQALGLVVESRHRRGNDRTHLRQRRHVAEMNRVNRCLSCNQNKATVFLEHDVGGSRQQIAGDAVGDLAKAAHRTGHHDHPHGPE